MDKCVCVWVSGGCRAHGIQSIRLLPIARVINAKVHDAKYDGGTEIRRSHQRRCLIPNDGEQRKAALPGLQDALSIFHGLGLLDDFVDVDVRRAAAIPSIYLLQNPNGFVRFAQPEHKFRTFGHEPQRNARNQCRKTACDKEQAPRLVYHIQNGNVKLPLLIDDAERNQRQQHAHDTEHKRCAHNDAAASPHIVKFAEIRVDGCRRARDTAIKHTQSYRYRLSDDYERLANCVAHHVSLT